MNRDEIPINFFGVQITGPAWILLLLVFVAGWVVGVLTTRKRLKGPRANG
ncbi:LapA family protein [Dietzia sp. NPDC055877]